MDTRRVYRVVCTSIWNRRDLSTIATGLTEQEAVELARKERAEAQRFAELDGEQEPSYTFGIRLTSLAEQAAYHARRRELEAALPF